MTIKDLIENFNITINIIRGMVAGDKNASSIRNKSSAVNPFIESVLAIRALNAINEERVNELKEKLISIKKTLSRQEEYLTEEEIKRINEQIKNNIDNISYDELNRRLSEIEEILMNSVPLKYEKLRVGSSKLIAELDSTDIKKLVNLEIYVSKISTLVQNMKNLISAIGNNEQHAEYVKYLNERIVLLIKKNEELEKHMKRLLEVIKNINKDITSLNKDGHDITKLSESEINSDSLLNDIKETKKSIASLLDKENPRYSILKRLKDRLESLEIIVNGFYNNNAGMSDMGPANGNAGSAKKNGSHISKEVGVIPGADAVQKGSKKISESLQALEKERRIDRESTSSNHSSMTIRNDNSLGDHQMPTYDKKPLRDANIAIGMILDDVEDAISKLKEKYEFIGLGELAKSIQDIFLECNDGLEILENGEINQNDKKKLLDLLDEQKVALNNISSEVNKDNILSMKDKKNIEEQIKKCREKIIRINEGIANIEHLLIDYLLNSKIERLDEIDKKIDDYLKPNSEKSSEKLIKWMHKKIVEVENIEKTIKNKTNGKHINEKTGELLKQSLEKAEDLKAKAEATIAKKQSEDIISDKINTADGLLGEIIVKYNEINSNITKNDKELITGLIEEAKKNILLLKTTGPTLDEVGNVLTKLKELEKLISERPATTTNPTNGSTATTGSTPTPTPNPTSAAAPAPAAASIKLIIHDTRLTTTATLTSNSGSTANPTNIKAKAKPILNAFNRRLEKIAGKNNKKNKKDYTVESFNTLVIEKIRSSLSNIQKENYVKEEQDYNAKDSDENKHINPTNKNSAQKRKNDEDQKALFLGYAINKNGNFYKNDTKEELLTIENKLVKNSNSNSIKETVFKVMTDISTTDAPPDAGTDEAAVRAVIADAVSKTVRNFTDTEVIIGDCNIDVAFTLFKDLKKSGVKNLKINESITNTVKKSGTKEEKEILKKYNDELNTPTSRRTPGAPPN